MFSKIFNTKRNRILALLMGAVMLLSLTAAGIGATLAAYPSITEEFTAPNLSGYRSVEVGKTADRPVVNAHLWVNSDPSILTLSADLDDTTAFITGLKAGTAIVSVGTSKGAVQGLKYQITDSNNITKYILANGGEGVISATDGSGTLTIPIRTFTTDSYGVTTENSAAKSTITWSTFRTNDPVASVDQYGVITGSSKGATIIIGKFDDKWGQPHDVHFLVMVGIGVASSDLDRLLELIAEAERILALSPNPYTSGSLSDLEQAKTAGESAASGGMANDIPGAITGLENAIAGLVIKDNGVIPGNDGHYYKPVGVPPNVYEDVNQDGSSKQPPKYVYDANGNPGDGVDGPAYHYNGNYYIENPTNIFKQVDSDGSIIESPAIWGGPDGKLGGGDDKIAIIDNGNYYVQDPENIYKKIGTDGNIIETPAMWGGPDRALGTNDDEIAVKIDGDYYVRLGQNVFQKITVPATLGPMLGGGTDGDPTTNPLQNIVVYGGKFYSGPYGLDSYYIGDSVSSNDGLTTNGSNNLHDTIASSDQKYWLSNGVMTPTDPGTVLPPVPGGNPGAADAGRKIDGTKAGDTSDWLELATNGDYSLIIRTKPIGQYDSVPLSITAVANWNTSLSASAQLRNYIVKNTGHDGAAIYSLTGLSKPVAAKPGASENAFFLLSYGEAAKYCSTTYSTGETGSITSSSAAIANFNLLEQKGNTWIGTTGVNNSMPVSSRLNSAGNLYAAGADASWTASAYPAVWVRSTALTAFAK